jgi:formylglycine-generating enzyme required for sulfatase activity
LLGNPMPGNQPAHCAWNTDFVPPGWTGMFAPGEENLPVGNVDWCDAAAYCASVGKRLCGKVGGGPAPKSLMVDPINEQWFRSCSEGGIRTYPYGAAYAPMACNGDDFGADAPVEVKSAMGCEGAYCGIFDMVGNVGEWVDMCDDPPMGESDLCFVLGGDYNGKNDMQQTECLTFADLTRTITSPTIGFRCCQDE